MARDSGQLSVACPCGDLSPIWLKNCHAQHECKIIKIGDLWSPRLHQNQLLLEFRSRSWWGFNASATTTLQRYPHPLAGGERARCPLSRTPPLLSALRASLEPHVNANHFNHWEYIWSFGLIIEWAVSMQYVPSCDRRTDGHRTLEALCTIHLHCICVKHKKTLENSYGNKFLCSYLYKSNADVVLYKILMNRQMHVKFNSTLLSELIHKICYYSNQNMRLFWKKR